MDNKKWIVETLTKHPYLAPILLKEMKPRRRIKNPVTGTWYEIRNKSSKAGEKEIKSLWRKTK